MSAAQSLSDDPGLSPRGIARSHGSPDTGGVVPQGCLGCVGAIAVCGATCLLGPEVCVPCLASIGMSQCLDCLTDVF